MLEKETSWFPGKNYCGNHPHNFYIQLFAETGVVGLIFGTLMFYFIFYTCYTGRKNIPQCPMISISYIIPSIFSFRFNKLGVFLANGEIYLFGFQLDFVWHRFKIINQFLKNNFFLCLSKIIETLFELSIKLFQDFFW